VRPCLSLLQGSKLLDPWSSDGHAVPESRYITSNLSCVKSQKSKDLTCTVSEAWNHARLHQLTATVDDGHSHPVLWSSNVTINCSVMSGLSMLCKIPEEQGSHMHCVRSLKPCKNASAYSDCWWRSLSSCSLVLQCDHQLFSYVRPTFSWIFAAQFGRIIWCQHEILISDDYKYNIEVIPLKCSQIWGTELLCLKVRRPLWLLLLVRRQTKSL